jgi:hypothetical protein
MRCIIRWLKRSRPAKPIPQQRLEALLQAARRSVHYRRQQIRIPCESGVDPRELASVLQSLPPLSLEIFLRSPADFYNWAAAPAEPQRLECHLPQTGRTAVLASGFEETDTVRCFPYQPFEELAEFQPESLAGPVQRLCRLAETVTDRRIELGSLRHAVIAFTGLKHGCLKDEQRDLLWRVFQVPVYEQFRGFSQELLAWECEAREGLHIHGENAIFECDNSGRLLVTCIGCTEYTVLRMRTDLEARLEMDVCGCGEVGVRLTGLRAAALPEQTQAAMARA